MKVPTLFAAVSCCGLVTAVAGSPAGEGTAPESATVTTSPGHVHPQEQASWTTSHSQATATGEPTSIMARDSITRPTLRARSAIMAHLQARSPGNAKDIHFTQEANAMPLKERKKWAGACSKALEAMWCEEAEVGHPKTQVELTTRHDGARYLVDEHGNYERLHEPLKSEPPMSPGQYTPTSEGDNAPAWARARDAAWAREEANREAKARKRHRYRQNRKQREREERAKPTHSGRLP